MGVGCNQHCGRSAGSGCIQVVVEEVCKSSVSTGLQEEEKQRSFFQAKTSSEASRCSSASRATALALSEKRQDNKALDNVPESSGKSIGLGRLPHTEVQKMQGELEATQFEVRALQVQNKALRSINSDAAPVKNQPYHSLDKTYIEEELKNQKELVRNLMHDFSTVYDELVRRPDLVGNYASQSGEGSQHNQFRQIDALDSVSGCIGVGKASAHTNDTLPQHSAEVDVQRVPVVKWRETQDHEPLAGGETVQVSPDFPQRCAPAKTTDVAVREFQSLDQAEKRAFEALHELLAKPSPLRKTKIHPRPQVTSVSKNNSLNPLVTGILEGRSVAEWVDVHLETAPLHEPRLEAACQVSWPSPCDAFSRFRLGANLILSEDACTLTRERGCRQAVAVGNGSLRANQHGWYFEVEISEVIGGWMGGLGIGVIVQDMNSFASFPDRFPDKAWRLPNTYIAGYWGRIFCAGKEHRTVWNAEELEVNDRVGFLVTTQGEILVFVNGKQKAWLNAGIPVPSGTSGRILLPVVDVFSATKSICFVKGAEPPMPPWSAPPTPVDALSPGSPESALGSPSHEAVNASYNGK